ncbi:MAG: hypothetical protein RI952_1638, partial [Bacteroidota bacterium]
NIIILQINLEAIQANQNLEAINAINANQNLEAIQANQKPIIMQLKNDTMTNELNLINYKANK